MALINRGGFITGLGRIQGPQNMNLGKEIMSVVLLVLQSLMCSRVDYCALKLSCCVMECPTNSLSLLKSLAQALVSVSRYGSTAMVPGSPQTTLATPFPVNHTHCLPGFEITETHCQQACRGFGKSSLALVTTQSSNCWKKTLKIRGGFVWLFSSPFSEFPSSGAVYLESLWNTRCLLNVLPGCSCPLCVVSCYSFPSNLYSTAVSLLAHVWGLLQRGKCKLWTYLFNAPNP